MKAGRELDALVAEKVMGWRYVGDMTDYPALNRTLYERPNGQRLTFIPSTSIADAWMVVEKMSDQFFNCTISKSASVNGGNVYVLFHGYTGKRIGNTYDEKGDTAPLAICLAALKAVGVEVPS